jgi:uncharacterized repeat protein (TIGR02543 family)
VNSLARFAKKGGLALISALLIGTTLLPVLGASMVSAAPTNLINNPLVETPDPSNANVPANWQVGNWGTNTFTSSYLKTGPTGDSNSVNINMTSYTSGDAKWYFSPVAVEAGAQYTYSDSYESTVPSDVTAEYIDGSGNASYVDLGEEAASTTWNQTQDTFTVPAGTQSMSIFHLINSVGSLTMGNFSLASSSTATAPTVNITAPAANSVVSGSSVPLAASAAATDGIASVQFQVDGSNVGSPVTAAPYQYTWDSTTVANGTHNITAVATDVDGVATTSVVAAINVNNAVAPGTNLIGNPLVETANPSNANAPLGWQTGNWGTNTFTSSYLKTGPTGDSNSVNINMTSYTSGDAKWYFNPVAIQAGTQYAYSESYQSSTASTVNVVYTMSDGSTEYVDIGDLAASASWQNFSANFVAPAGAVSATVYHFIASTGSLTTSNFSLATSSTAIAPTVTAPAASTSTSTPYSGSVTLAASATDSAGVASVQFQIDGSNVGSPVTASPYQYSWNSTAVTNGTHNITAVVTGVDGKTATSAPVSIEVSNAAAAGGNIIPNPLMTTPDPSNPNAPEDWSVDSWGTNTFTSSYLNTGSTGDPNSAEIDMTSYTSGDAKWVFAPQNVSQDTQYQFTDHYESSAQTLVDAVFTMSDGSTDYEIIGIPYASSTWAEFTTKFSVPLGAQTVTIYHVLQSVGTLTIDNASLNTYLPTGFSRPLVTLTFDDGYASTYTNGLPILQQYGFTSTQFIITDLIGQTGYMTAAQIKAYYAAGDEIASHTVTHDDLTQETAAQLKTEMTQSQATLQTDTGAPVTDMAYPYGLYNAAAVSATQAVYSGARGVESGLNSKDNFNPYDLKVEDVYTTTTTAQVADWVAQAQATNTWLVLVYHGVDADTTSPVDGDIYDVTPTQLSAQMAAIQASGITVETMSQALAEVNSQVNTVTPYIITFNSNGGSGTMAAETNSTSTALTINSFVRTGYTFAGWNTAANGTGTAYVNGAIYPFTASTTLYAQWTANPVSHTVTFNANSGTGTMIAETSSTSKALTTNSFTRTGYTFSGWNTAKKGTGTAYANGAAYQFTANTTLYAQWTKVAASHTVTFNANGGTGTMAIETNNASTALTTNSFVRTGYTFAGWNTAKKGTGTTYANGAAYPFIANTTLYAQWTKTA